MPEAYVGASSLIDWGVAALALEAESGDLHGVRTVGQGVLVSAVDGLGHGAEAASAARTAVATLDRHADGAVVPLVERVHQSLRGTRGAVLSLAFLDGANDKMTWLGVGNVEGVLCFANPTATPTQTSLVTRAGIVGVRLPRLGAEVIRIAPGDTLIFATDGIRGGFADGLPTDVAPQQLADHILTRHRTGTDDALVLVARYIRGTGAAA
jgi:hypothetical protein